MESFFFAIENIYMNFKRPLASKPSGKKELIFLSLKVPRGLKDAFKAKVASQGKKMGPIIMQFMQNYIKK